MEYVVRISPMYMYIELTVRFQDDNEKLILLKSYTLPFYYLCAMDRRDRRLYLTLHF